MSSQDEDTNKFKFRIRDALDRSCSQIIMNEVPSYLLSEKFKGKFVNNPIIRTEESMKFPDAYSPRCDVAIGPFSYLPGRNLNDIYKELLRLQIIKDFISKIEQRSLARPNEYRHGFNKNPRCFISFEIEHSTAGDLKHVLGSLSNASFMGKVGVVIFYDHAKDRISNLIRYLYRADEKLHLKMFRNACFISKTNFDEILASLDERHIQIENHRARPI